MLDLHSHMSLMGTFLYGTAYEDVYRWGVWAVWVVWIVRGMCGVCVGSMKVCDM